MWRRTPKEPALQPRAPHPNPVIESRLLLMDLQRRELGMKHEAVQGLQVAIGDLLDEARRYPDQTGRSIRAIEAAREVIAELERDIAARTAILDENQVQAEAAEEHWLAQVTERDSAQVDLDPHQIQDRQDDENPDEHE